MAEITRLVLDGEVITQIRGRVFKFGRKKVRRDGVPKVAEKRTVCVLNQHDGANLEHWNKGQSCHGADCRHSHMTRAAVDSLVRDGILRFAAGSGKNVAVYSYGRTWKAVPSGGPQAEKVMQLV